jgi:uncharacterized protein YejL (UPF0352 family)
MYVTADGNEEVVMAEFKETLGEKGAYQNLETTDRDSTTPLSEILSDVHAEHGLRAGVNTEGATATGQEIKTESIDVKKVSKIITDDTPAEGRTVLLDYLMKVEKEIATEVAGRKADIAALRVQMAKNRAYNAKARASMKKELLARMAVNAKKAKDDLDEQMRLTAKHFAAAAALENKRWKKNNKRFKKTREIMKKNKASYAHELKMATLNQQRSLAALDAATNAKIHATNQNIAKNAADIKANAIKARQDLDTACDNFNTKMYNVNEEAKKGRDKLAADAAAMDKKVRAMISLKVNRMTKAAAKNFQKVRATMAKDRHHADMMLAQTSSKMKSALAAQAALQDERFKQTVADIAATKAEADARVDEMKKSFKSQIISLSSTVNEHMTKLNSRVTNLQGVVTSNKLEQAKVNTQVTKEISDMIKVGNDRESALAKKDVALKDLMAKNKAENEKKMVDMSSEFYSELTKIRAQMAKDRKYQEGRLSKQTSELFSVLEKNKAAQDAKNEELSAATKAAADAAEEALDEAKHHFSNRLGALHTTVVENDKKANGKIEKLTGVVAVNAMKDAAGRQQLKALADANKLELKNSIREAVAAGEKRARAIEKMAEGMNKKTRDAMNSRISTEIGELTKKIHSDVEGLQLQTKEARAEMRAQVLASLRDETTLLKSQLETAIKDANAKMVALHEQLDEEVATSGEARAALKDEIDAERALAIEAVGNAVALQAQGLLALKTETAEKIKKTNTKVTAYGDAIIKHAGDVKATMEANVAALTGQLEAAKEATKKALTDAEKASMARHEAAITAITDGLAAAEADMDKKFDNTYIKMAENRNHADEALAAATSTLNKAIASHAALQDSRFSTTVKNIEGAKKEAADAVVAAKKEFAMGLADVTATLKATEQRIEGDIAIVSKMARADKASQAIINKKVDAEIKRLEELSNSQHSESKRARGKILELFNKNKAIAAQEISDLKSSTSDKLEKLRSEQAALSLQHAEELTEATTELYAKMAQDKIEQTHAMTELKASLNLHKASIGEDLKKLKDEFGVRFTDLTGVVSSNHAKYEERMEEVTGVVFDWKTAADADRELIREEQRAMNADLNKRIVKAIQIGEAKAKQVLEGATANIGAMQSALLADIGMQVENMANTVLDTVLEDRGTIANNYLSLKGYAGAAQDKIIDYVQKGEGKGLSSIGDLLQQIAIVSEIKTKPAMGLSAGGGEITPAFGGDLVPDVAEITKVNGLCDEYYKVRAMVDGAWPYGLGKYLLMKLSASMAGTGVLTVGKKDGAAGQWVYINSEAVGLSSHMSEFEDVAVRITAYQDFLAQLAATLPAIQVAKPIVVPPPEWDGTR